MSAYWRYPKEEWDSLLKKILPMTAVTDSLFKQSIGIDISIHLIVGISEETYEMYRAEYERLSYFHNFEAFRSPDIRIPIGHDILKPGVMLAFGLEMPFRDLPLYANSANSNLSKIVKERLRLGK